MLRQALAPLRSHINAAFIYGSVARLRPTSGSDVDLMVIGDASFGDIVSAMAAAQKTLSREINPTVYSPREFRSKLRARHHFLSSVLKGEKLFLLGNQDELARLGPIRVAHRARK